MQYQHDIIFALLLFCSKFSYKTNISNILLLFYANNRNFKLLEHTYYVFNSYDVIFHAASDANDVIIVDVKKLHHFETVIRLKF